MKILPTRNCLRLAIVSLAVLSTVQAQSQAPPSVSYDSFNDVLQLDWQSSRNRTFFPQVTTDLGTWDYIGALHFGTGSHTGLVQTNAAKAFFRLQYSDLPVATEDEAGTADFDLDGLQNLVELQQEHTDPLNSDTDGDTLPDGWEVAHSISPLDDGSIDVQNGPDGTSLGSTTTNANARVAGVQAHPAATLTDKDGDGIPDDEDAGPLSSSIDWETDNSWPRFIYIELPDYSFSSHGTVVGCNERGDVIASKAVLLNGVWQPLAQLATGSSNYLPVKVQVGPRQHRAYAMFQPIPTSISNDGKIVGRGDIGFESITEEISSEESLTYSLADTAFGFIWDTPSSTPRLFAHPPQSVLNGHRWDESAQIADDGTVVLRRRANTSANNNQYRFIRYKTNGLVEETGSYPVWLPSLIGPKGFQAFNEGTSNAYSWVPGASSPQSLLANATFSTPNPRSTFIQSTEPIFIGTKPGAEGGFALNFWGKTMLHHEGRWQEAVELGNATLLTGKGIAFNSRTPTAVQVWKGGRWSSLATAVTNKSFSSLSVFPMDSTADGRTLVRYQGSGMQLGYGYLIPLQVAVDADRNGEIEFGKEKNTYEEPFCFWINNDRDIGHTVDNDDWEEDDVDAMATDASLAGLDYSRDLEDLTRLWIDFSGISDAFPAGDPTVMLKVRLASESGNPGITFFQPVEADGGRAYLKDENVGHDQLQGVYGQELCRINGPLSVEIPRRAWETLPEDKVVHLLFEGAGQGHAEVIFELWRNGTRVCDFPPVYLLLSKVEDMYETWTVGDVADAGVDFSKWPAPVATQSYGQTLPAPTTSEESDYIMFVHGWNMPPWEKGAFASTMFKRMWHQGYKGRFGAFRWPTFHGLTLDEPWDLHTAHFDGSEQRAWNSASALRNLLSQRATAFGANKIRLYAHSMGNIVCSEALRQRSPGSDVRIYISAQAALSSHVWDNTTPSMPITLPVDMVPPDVYGYYWQTGATTSPHSWSDEGRPSYMDSSYMPLNTIYINHYNPFDWALSHDNWQRTQALKPDVDYHYSAPPWDTTDERHRFWSTPSGNLGFPVDRFEIFSYAAQSHGYATGQQGSTSGMFDVVDSLNLFSNFGFESAHKGHSAQFRSTVQKRWTYWRRALVDFEINLPPQ